MNEPLETLLASELLEPPGDFTQQVMRGIESRAQCSPPSPSKRWLEWVALIGGSIMGAGQLVALAFGVWAAVAAV